MTSTPDPVDERLLAAHDLARAALLEITSEATIGEPAGYIDEGDGVISLRFANRLSGYPGWFWTVSVARADADAEPTVLEVELLPGEDALLAPEWVPWAVRLAEYQAAQSALAEAAEVAGESPDLESDEDELDEDDLDGEELDDVLGDDLDDDELDEDGSPILHAGDVDGVDIDELDDSVAAEPEEADEADEDDLDEDDEDDLDEDDDSDEDDLDENEGSDDPGDEPAAH